MNSRTGGGRNGDYNIIQAQLYFTRDRLRSLMMCSAAILIKFTNVADANGMTLLLTMAQCFPFLCQPVCFQENKSHYSYHFYGGNIITQLKFKFVDLRGEAK